MRRLLTDTGFWIALFDSDRQPEQHRLAQEMFGLFDGNQVFVPWPVIYETLDTRFVKDKRADGRLARFDQILRRPEVTLLDDETYRESALEEIFRRNRLKRDDVPSLVDSVLHQILQDDTYRFDHLLTFNYRDFADICRKRKIEINIQ